MRQNFKSIEFKDGLQGFLPDEKTGLLLRDEYHTIYTIIKDDKKGVRKGQSAVPGKGMVVTGQPGIGK